MFGPPLVAPPVPLAWAGALVLLVGGVAHPLTLLTLSDNECDMDLDYIRGGLHMR